MKKHLVTIVTAMLLLTMLFGSCVDDAGNLVEVDDLVRNEDFEQYQDIINSTEIAPIYLYVNGAEANERYVMPIEVDLTDGNITFCYARKQESGEVITREISSNYLNMILITKSDRFRIIGNTGGIYAWSYYLNTDASHHLYSINFSDNYTYFYEDGVLLTWNYYIPGSLTISAIFSTNDTLNNLYECDYSVGELGYFSIYNRSLTVDEIANLKKYVFDEYYN